MKEQLSLDWSEYDWCDPDKVHDLVATTAFVISDQLGKDRRLLSDEGLGIIDASRLFFVAAGFALGGCSDAVSRRALGYCIGSAGEEVSAGGLGLKIGAAEHVLTELYEGRSIRSVNRQERNKARDLFNGIVKSIEAACR